MDNFNRLVGAKGLTGGGSRHVMVYWSTNCQGSMLCSVYGRILYRKEALVARMQSFVIRESCLEGQRPLGRQEERYVVFIRFCNPFDFCYKCL